MSDMLKHGSWLLHKHLSMMYKILLTHGVLPLSFLKCYMIPLVKDDNGDLCSSKNYRSIALSSLFLKLFDWVVLILYGEKLASDMFQFGFKPKSNTMMCSWLLSEVVDRYNREGSDVYVCLMDCTKAFDTISHSKLFQKLMERDIPATYARLIFFSYKQQSAAVSWKGMLSQDFPVTCLLYTSPSPRD